eukprot:scaffold19442_cov112-Isochrysis_galbana.AAC.4
MCSGGRSRGRLRRPPRLPHFLFRQGQYWARTSAAVVFPPVAPGPPVQHPRPQRTRPEQAGADRSQPLPRLPDDRVDQQLREHHDERCGEDDAVALC